MAVMASCRRCTVTGAECALWTVINSSFASAVDSRPPDCHAHFVLSEKSFEGSHTELNNPKWSRDKFTFECDDFLKRIMKE